MDRAHAPDEWLTIDRNYTAVRKQTLESFDRSTVIGVTEDREKYDAVGNVKVCVAGRQSIEISSTGACSTDSAGHRQRYDFERTPVRVGHGPEPREIVLQYFIVGVGRIIFAGAHDNVWRNEASDVVDMPVSVVSKDTLAEPQDLCYSEIVF